MSFAAWILAMVGPMVVRGLLALSFTAITFTGVTELAGVLVSSAQSSWSSMPVAVLQLVTLSGVPEVMGLIFGAMTARVAMWAAVSASRYVFKS